MNITIRPATTNDFPAIYPLVCGLEEEVFDEAALQQCYEQCLAAKNSHYLVAVEGNHVIGFIGCLGQVLLHHCGLVYEIQELYVLPEYRSKGIGKQLVSELEQIIAPTKYELLEVASNMMRKDAHRFYEANGFLKTSFKFKRVESKSDRYSFTNLSCFNSKPSAS